MLIFERELGDFSGYTVLLPAVSVGNAGQLCMDVILENINREKLESCQVLHPSVVPIVGPDPLNKSSVLTAMQVYIVKDQSLILFQLRSGLLPGQGAAFIQDFVSWFQESKCKDLIVIGSMHSHERVDKQITGTSLRYLSTNGAKQVPDNFVKLEPRSQETQFEHNKTEDPASGPFVPGGGVSSRIYYTCLQKNIPITLMLKFCSEGDNRIDGLELSEYVNTYINIIPDYSGQKSKIPASWQYLFGHSAPVHMFG